MIFPLWRFWTFTPWGFLAAIIWNCSEILKVRCPFAPFMFGLIMGASGRKVR